MTHTSRTLLPFVVLAALAVYSNDCVCQKPQTLNLAPKRAAAAKSPTDSVFWTAKNRYTGAYSQQIADFWTIAMTEKYGAKGTGANGQTLLSGTPEELTRILNLFMSGTGLMKESDSILAASLETADAYAQAYAKFESQRLDKQVGQSPTSSSSSNLVAKPGTSALLSLASESGAFSQTVNGTTMTLTTTPYRLFQLALGDSGLQTLCVLNSSTKSQNCNSLSRISIATSFVVSQAGSTSSTTTTTSGSANSSTPAVSSVLLPTSSAKFSSVTARYSLGTNTVDPSGQKFQDSWRAAVGEGSSSALTAQAAFAKAMDPVIATLIDPNDPVLMPLRMSYKQKFIKDAMDGNTDQFALDFQEYSEKAIKVAEGKDPVKYASAIAEAKLAYNNAIVAAQDALDTASGKPLVTFSYTYSKPQSQPDLHDFRIIGAESFKGHGGQLTFNFAADVYGGTINSGSKYQRLKDYQFSGQWDMPLGNIKSPFGTWSNAGYAQYQYKPSVLDITSGNLAPGTNITLPKNAQVLIGTSGYLEVFQSQLTFKLPKSINLPIAIKWSNKTDLLNAQDVRGQIGLSYDFSQLTSLLSGNR